MSTSVAEQSQITHEQQRSFNVLASVNMFRYDLEHFGQVLPETRERVSDEELSYLTEGIDRAACTEFALWRLDDGDFAYSGNGELKSYAEMLYTGRSVAIKEAEKDPRKQFLADDANNDLYHYYQMRKLQPGEQHVWFSEYRYDIEQRYGKDFMKSCGRFPDRQMGFVYRAYCGSDGNVVLQSQTVDRSDIGAFTAVKDYASLNPNAEMPELLYSYDSVLQKKHGRDFYAGRTDSEIDENAWKTILAQEDLIHFFISKLESIAASDSQGWSLEEATKKHVYGVWAAFKKRLDRDGKSESTKPYEVKGSMPAAHLALLNQEVQQAFTDFAVQGRVLIGCGGAIAMLRGERDILDASTSDVFNAIFGRGDSESDGPDGKGPLKFRCKYGHLNTRPFGKLISECRVSSCKNSVGC